VIKGRPTDLAVARASRKEDWPMSVVEKARRLFQEAGLAFPMVPMELAAKLKEQGKWLFSTRELKTSPYNLQHYVDEADGDAGEYAILSHSGHGANSYAIQYYLVSGPLRLFLHLGWGGAYMDAEADASKIRECFSLADQIVAAAVTSRKLAASERLTAVGSDFYGSHWSAPGQPGHAERVGEQGPADVLTEVLRWLQDPSPNQPPQEGYSPMKQDSIERRIFDALVALLHRGTEDSFVLIQEPKSEKFVQFGKGRCICMDVPFVELSNSEAERAYPFFQKLGEEYPREYNAPDPKSGKVHHGATFYHEFGTDVRAATSAAMRLFVDVFGFPPDVELSIEEH
jgi:hypothetical protein